MATILIVDDDPKIRDLLRLYVEREGHRALFAADGQTALATALEKKPDLVLLDVMLPGLDGLEVCRRPGPRRGRLRRQAVLATGAHGARASAVAAASV